MSSQIIKRINWFDGQEVDETDFDTEQNAWHTTDADNTDAIIGSGILKEFSEQRVLFDLNSVPVSINTLLTGGTFDGEPIYPTDSLGNVVYLQPSDSAEGTQLQINISGANLLGSAKSKIFIFGTILNNKYVQEVIEFEDNGTKITKNYFTKIVAFMTQDFRGNTNNLIDGVASRNTGGTLQILEAIPFTVALDSIMAEQSTVPNMDYVNFKPSSLIKTLDILLAEISASDGLNVDDLNINTTSTTTRLLPTNTPGLIVGEKFKATTNNIQKISILLSIQSDSTAVPGHEFDWSGNIVVGVRALQKTLSCPLNTIPNSAILFDPEPSNLAEISFDQTSLGDAGVVLSDQPKVVDFVFTQSLLANPNIEPSLVPGDFYILTITRSGDLSKGVFVLEEAANTTSATETDEMMMSVFFQNEWTDVEQSDLWFKIYTDAIRITNGTAYDSGVAVVSPKITTDPVTELDSPYINGHYNLIDVSSSTENYVVLQQQNEFSDPISHPSTGNDVFSRIEDSPKLSVMNETDLTDLISSGDKTIVLGAVRDSNPVSVESITGITEFAGLARTNTFTILQPVSDIANNNLIGSILTPNTSKSTLRYRIIKVEIFEDGYGDVNDDGVINSSDVLRAQQLDGYATNLYSGTISMADQQYAISSGLVTMEELIRADVNVDGIISVVDAQLIQQHISLGTSFIAGSSFRRAVLTVENILNPLSTSANILGNDSDFNNVPFSNIEFRIDFIPTWSPDNVVITDLRRYVSRTFTSITTTDITGTTKNGGSNSFFVPGDLILGGSVLDDSGSNYNFDFEVNTITIDLPAGETNGEIDIFDNYIKNKMKFFDGSLVGASAISNGQVKATVAIQSITKDLDGYDMLSVDGNPPIDESISLLYIQSSGLLRVRTNNIRYIGTRPELRSKIVITVYLKKSGFENTNVSVSSSEFVSLLSPL